MLFEFFIARRILKNRSATRKVAKPVLSISVWAIAMGLIIMILAISTGNGLRKAIKNKVTGFGGDIQILNYSPTPTYEQVPISLEAELISELQAVPNIAKVQAYGQKAGILKNEDLFEGAVLKGIGAQYDLGFMQEYLLEGSLPQYKDGLFDDSIIISAPLARKLKLALHDQCEMYFLRPNKAPLRRRFILAGIFQTDFDKLDRSFIIGDLDHVQRLSKWDSSEVGAWEIHFGSKESPEGFLEDLRLKLPFEYDAMNVRSLNLQLFQWLDLFDLNILLIIGIIIIVATINMSIALLILIMERTTMIGLLKALGASNPSIQKIFLLNATYLIGKGLLWGNAIGIGLALVQDHFGLIKLDPSTYYVSAVSIDLNFWHILSINAVTLIICLLCLLIPSFLVSRVRPTKAIRFD
ncbi:MAG: ABC transporter permease [Croceimicrobium sp.]